MTDSSILAVDLAFLLPAHLNQAVTRINHSLLPPPDGFRFDAHHLPHLSLIQQFVRRDSLDEIRRTVTKTVAALDALPLATTDLAGGRVTHTLGVEPTAELSALHRRLFDALGPFQTETSDPNTFWTDGDAPRPADLEWVASFRAQAAGAAFEPHITLGVGAIETTLPPTHFVASEVVLCQLGRFCTCCHVLDAWTLTDRGR